MKYCWPATVGRAGPAGSDTGCGLGLSIVASVASAHGGSLELHAPASGGLAVDVLLLAAAESVAQGAGLS